MPVFSQQLTLKGVDTDPIELIDKATAETGKYDHLTHLQHEVSAVVVNAYPKVAASEALAAVREVWTQFNREKPRLEAPGRDSKG